MEAGLVAPIPGRTMNPPYPAWYTVDAHCKYHAGAPGHNLENCFALKKRVQLLQDLGWLDFKKEAEKPNHEGNPLPDHA